MPASGQSSARVKLLAAIGALAVIVTGAIFFRPLPSSIETAREDFAVTLARTNLVLNSGRLQYRGSDQAFSGIMVEHYGDGTLLSRSMVSNGLLHGLSEGFYTNGQVQVTEHFQQGISSGLRTKWYSSGGKLSEGAIVDGKFHGGFKRWSEEGVLLEQAEFSRGIPEGNATAYFPSGYLKSWTRMQDGQVIDRKSWNDGERTNVP